MVGQVGADCLRDGTFALDRAFRHGTFIEGLAARMLAAVYSRDTNVPGEERR